MTLHMTIDESKACIDEYHDEYRKLFDTLGYTTLLLFQSGKFYQTYAIKPRSKQTDINAYDSLSKDELDHRIQVGKVVEHAMTVDSHFAQGTTPPCNGIQYYISGMPVEGSDKHLYRLSKEGWTIFTVVQGRDPSTGKLTTTSKKKYRMVGEIITPEYYIENSYRSFILHMKVHNTYDVFGVVTISSSTGDVHLYTISQSDDNRHSELYRYIISRGSQMIYIYQHNSVTCEPDYYENLFRKAYNVTVFQCDPNIMKYTIANEIINNVLSYHHIKQHYISVAVQYGFADDDTIMYTLAHALKFTQDISGNDLITRLRAPEIYKPNSHLYCIDNAYEQLAVIPKTRIPVRSRTRNGFNSRKKIYHTIFDLVNHTKTSIGENNLQNRFVNISTDSQHLEKQYDMIEYILSCCDRNEMDTLRDMIHQCNIIGETMKNIRNHTECNPYTLLSYITSMVASTNELISYMKEHMPKLLPSDDLWNKFQDMICSRFDDNVFDHKAVEAFSSISKTKTMPDQIRISSYGSLTTDPIFRDDDNTCDILRDRVDTMNDIMTNVETTCEPYMKTYESSTRKRGTSQCGGGPYFTMNVKTSTTKSKKKTEHYLSYSCADAVKKRMTPQLQSLHDICGGDIKLKSESAKSKVFALDSVKINKLLNDIMTEQESIVVKYISRIREYFSKCLSDDACRIVNQIGDFISELDVLQSFAYISREQHYTKPNVVHDMDKSYIDLQGVRHPLLEIVAEVESRVYVPIDISLGVPDKHDGMLLYSVNGVGKSSLMRSVACSVIMAQLGCYVAASHMTYSPYHRMFTRIMGCDDMMNSRSTFQVEISELIHITTHATNNRCLVFADEACSGTEMESAYALVGSTVKRLADIGCSFLFTTHNHDLTESAYLPSNVAIYHLTVEHDDNGNYVFTRELVPGDSEKIYGDAVAFSLGFPDDMRDLVSMFRKEWRVKHGQDTASNKKGYKVSKYNSDFVLSSCVRCGCDELRMLHTHHIIPQRDVDANGNVMLPSGIPISVHHKVNLICLCEPCHMSYHNDGDFKIEVDYATGVKKIC